MERLIGQVGGQAAAPEPGTRAAAEQATVTAPGFWCHAEAPAGRLLEHRAADHRQVLVGAAAARGTTSDTSELLARLQADRAERLAGLGGEYALVHHDANRGELLLATDHFGTLPIYYFCDGDALVFGTDLDWVSRRLPQGRRLNDQAVYDYLFYSVLTSERCIYAGIEKLPPGSALTWRDGRVAVRRYWNPDFSRAAGDRGDLGLLTVEAISAAVGRLATLPDTGCFLSGGLDSSTVSGMAARHAGAAVPAFTIGFDVPEYDERRYARITARHFGIELHEKTLRSEEISRCAERVIAAFPEPFGNPSAVPAFICAEFAREAGIARLLAGDGGDELFAGNERYQRQLLFEAYGGLPGWARSALVDPLAALSARAPGVLHKLASYVEQARMPLPDRLFSYNLLVRLAPAEVLTASFFASIDGEAPYRYARSLYAAPAAGDAVDRMMYLDWTTTLTDNDLPKVRVTSALAGVDVHFPMLDPEVVEISTRVPTTAKLTRRDLRRFYKQSFAAFLPREVIRKSKHGFGVPVGIWINRDAELRERVRARLDALGSRDIVRPAIIAGLLDLQATGHAKYYGSLIWPLYALEEWLQSRGL
ncbi:MAG: asparagine synthase C-terminal domain-containing protein [Gammaproteobacteria bacterium]|nr:asparagine synthase C-terminal domain-containing protein [Gammaproteobacteria bacterium]